MIDIILIIVGVGLLTLAGALWLLRGRLMLILNTVDEGFKTVQDSIFQVVSLLTTTAHRAI